MTNRNFFSLSILHNPMLCCVTRTKTIHKLRHKPIRLVTVENRLISSMFQISCMISQFCFKEPDVNSFDEFGIDILQLPIELVSNRPHQHCIVFGALFIRHLAPSPRCGRLSQLLLVNNVYMVLY